MMLNKPDVSKNNEKLITEIEEECLIIIEMIKRNPSKRSMKILHCLSQKTNLLPDNLPILAIVINTMRKYFTTKPNSTRDLKTENLIEDCLCSLITNLACFKQEEIINIFSCLKQAITGGVDAALEKKINKLISVALTRLPLFKDALTTQLKRGYEKSKSTFNSLKYPLNFFVNKLLLDPSLDFGLKNSSSLSDSKNFLAPEAEKTKNTSPEEKNSDNETRTSLILCGDEWIELETSASSLSDFKNFLVPEAEKAKNTSPEEKDSRKRTRVRLILCGDDRIGYECQLPQQQLKKKLEKKRPVQTLFEEKTTCLNEIIIEKNLTQEKLERKIEEKKLELVFFAPKKEVSLDLAIDFIQKKINKFKYSWVDFVLPNLKMIQENFFLNQFIKVTNYDEFKELFNFSEEILVAINKANKIIKKIDLFSKSLGISLVYANTLDDCYEKMKKCINREKIVEFLESALSLFKVRVLSKHLDYCLFYAEDRKKELESALNLFKDRALTKYLDNCIFYGEDIKEVKVPQEVSFLNLFIENNNPRKLLEQHREYLNKFFNQNSDSSLFKKKYLEQKSNYFKAFLNFLSIKHYFVNINHKNFFVKKFLINSYQYANFELVKKEIFKLKWWQFILTGINPYHVFKHEFKACLAEKLFLNLIEDEFQSIDIEREPYTKSIDALYSIQARLKASSLDTKTELLGLYGVNAPQSRQEIIDRLRSHEEFKNLLDEVQILTQGTNCCIDGFSKAVSKCQQENEKSVYTKISSVESTPNPNNSTMHFSQARLL